MRMETIMSRPVLSIGPGADVESAREIMRNRHVRHLVVSSQGEVAGVVSERDLVRRSSEVPVSDVMVPSAVVGTPDMTLRQAANLLRGRGIGCLPIVDGRKLVGIVTVTDLLDLLGRGAERPIERSQPWVLRGRGPRRALKDRVLRKRTLPRA